MNLEKHDIISLGNNRKYVILEILNHKNNKYLNLIEVDEEENLKEDIKIVKIVRNSKNEYGIDEISDKNELLEVSEIFFTMLSKN